MNTNQGWIPPDQRTAEQTEFNDQVLCEMAAFSLPMKDEGRTCLWDVARKAVGERFRYVWQSSGSCVGAGGANALRTLMAVEISLGQPEEYREVWWPWTYGQSRRLGGLRGPGEGSFGSAFYKAAKECGFFSVEQSPATLPDFRRIGPWLQLTSATEVEWSDGARWNTPAFTGVANRHPIQGGAVVRSVQDAIALVQSGYPLTIASMYGTRTITRQGGSEPVNVARRDDTWAHQMSIDEVWKHPTLGWLFRFMNQWGSSIHPAPVSGEPAGGFYVTEREFAQLLAERNTECFAFSSFAGFPAREINWYI